MPAPSSSGSSIASLMSDSTQLACVWATSTAPTCAGGSGGELVAVDQPHAGLDRVDAEPVPRHDRGTTSPAACGRRCRSSTAAACAPIARAPAASRARRRGPRRARSAAATRRSTISAYTSSNGRPTRTASSNARASGTRCAEGCCAVRRNRCGDARDRGDRLDRDVIARRRARARRRRSVGGRP